MSRPRPHLPLLAFLTLVLVHLPLNAAGPARLDPYGDPLPTGVRARLGTVRFRVQGPRGGFLLSPDGKTFAVEDWGGVSLMDARTGRVRHTLAGQALSEDAGCFSPDSRLLVTREGRRLHVWDVASGKESRSAPHKPGQATDGKTYIEMDDKCSLYGRDRATGKLLWSLPGEGNRRTFTLSPDSRTFAILEDSTIVLCDLRTGKRIRSLHGALMESMLTESSFVFTADGHQLIARDGHALRFWDTRTGAELRRPAGHLMPPSQMSFSADGRRVAVKSDCRAYVWETQTGKLLQTSTTQGGDVDTNVALSGNGHLAACASWTQDAPVHVWEVDTLRERYHFPRATHDEDLILRFSPNDRYLAVGLYHGTGVVLHDGTTGKQHRLIQQPGRELTALAFANGGKALAVVTRAEGSSLLEVKQPEVRLWDTATGAAVSPPLPAYGDLCFSCDDRLLAVGEGDVVTVWELASGKRVASFETDLDTACCRSMSFTPSGELLAALFVGDWYNALLQEQMEVWDVFANKKLHRLRVPGGGFECVYFAPRARWMLTAMADTSVLVWEPSVFSPEKRPQAGLNPEDLARLWQDLAGPDAERAQKAVRRLTASSHVAIAFLEERLRPAAATGFSRLIADLDANEYSVREAATRELVRIGPEVRGSLRAALRQGPGLEARKRIESLLARIVNGSLSPELLRQVRAVQILEQIGSPDARRLLTKLAGGAVEALLTQEAKASLDRLGGPTPEKP